jgi:hypothetical protein
LPFPNGPGLLGKNKNTNVNKKYSVHATENVEDVTAITLQVVLRRIAQF